MERVGLARARRAGREDHDGPCARVEHGQGAGPELSSLWSPLQRRAEGSSHRWHVAWAAQCSQRRAHGSVLDRRGGVIGGDSPRAFCCRGGVIGGVSPRAGAGIHSLSLCCVLVYTERCGPPIGRRARY